MGHLLEVDGLEAFYGRSQVLFGISFSIALGGITSLLGANGAGKTTTLRAISGTIRTAGHVRFEGAEIRGKVTEDIARLRIAHVPEGRGTFTSLTVEENLRIASYLVRDRAVVSDGLER